MTLRDATAAQGSRSLQARIALTETLRLTRGLLARVDAHSRPQALRLIGLMIAGALVEGAGLALLLPIVGIVVADESGNAVTQLIASVGIVDQSAQLALFLGLFVFAGLIRAQVHYLRDAASARFQTRFTRIERSTVVEQLSQARWTDIVGLSHARVGSLVTLDVDRAAMALSHLIRIVVTAVTLLVQATIAVVISPLLALLALLLIGVGLGYVFFAGRSALTLGAGLQASMRTMQRDTGVFMAGLKTSMAQNTQGAFLAELQTVMHRARAMALHQQTTQSGARRLFHAGTTLFGAVLVGGGVLLDVTAAQLIAVVLVLSRMSGPTLTIQQTIQHYQFALPSFREIQTLLAEIPSSPPMVSSNLTLDGSVELIEASYRYGSTSGGVGPVSLKIAPGEIVGLTGPSGAGKTTLLDMVTGLLPPQSGEVRVNGRILDEHMMADWRGALAYLTQSTFHANDTVRANLALSGTGPHDDATLWDALRLAGVADTLRARAHGLDTSMGEQGGTLSGGERQRVALARGLLRRPKLLILDEALAGVDVATEREIMRDLCAVPWTMSMLMVTHRLESLSHCDRVHVLAPGSYSGAVRCGVGREGAVSGNLRF
tara:strand:+ start:12180 stop:13988 length:1809 start_codon:yes stop_codon:yes gene_type:complete